MFETEAEEYADKYENNRGSLEWWSLRNSYQVGAVYGYDKAIKELETANEWHKDLPTEDIRLAIIEVEDCGYILCNYRKGFWYDNNSGATCAEWITNNIVRWKEIILPEEIE